MSKINLERKSRRGHPLLDLPDRRTHCVSVRLNDAELEQLERQRGALKRGEWLRMAALDQLPPVIPQFNIKAWLELSKSAANLNQIAFKLNGGEAVGLEKIRSDLTNFRNSLLGLSSFEEDEEDKK